METIYSYGGGAALVDVLNGIAMIFNNGVGDSIVEFMSVMGIAWVGIQSMMENSFKPQVKWMVKYVVILDLLIIPKSSLLVRDVVTNQVNKVDNLPIGLTIPAGLVSSLGFAITKEFESVFSSPDYLQYHKYGTVFGAQLISEARNFKIQDPIFRENMESYIDNCVMYDVMIGHKYTIRDLKNHADLWSLITSKSSKLKMLNYRDGDRGRTLTTCFDTVKLLEQHWNRDYQLVEKRFPLLSKLTSSDNKAGLVSSFNANMDAVLSFYGSKQTSAQSYIKQLMVINAISDVPLSYGAVRASQQQKESWVLAGELAKQNLPIMHSIFEALIYSSFTLVFGLMLLPGGFKIAGTYFGMMLWIQLWPPLFAILNLLINSFNKGYVKSLIADDGITMANINAVASSGSMAAAAAGGLGIFIPVISYMIIKGGAAQFVHIAGQLSSATQSAASNMSNEITSGNRSFDNMSLGTQSFMNQSGFKQDFNTSQRQGHMEGHLNDGTVVKTMPGGNTISHSGAGITTSTGAQSFRQSDMVSGQIHQQMAHERSLMESESKEYSSMQQSMERKAIDFVARIAKGESSGEHYEYSQSTGSGNSFGDTIERTKDLHERYGYSWQQSADLTLTGGLGYKSGSSGDGSISKVIMSKLLSKVPGIKDMPVGSNAGGAISALDQDESGNLGDKSVSSGGGSGIKGVMGISSYLKYQVLMTCMRQQTLVVQ